MIEVNAHYCNEADVVELELSDGPMQVSVEIGSQQYNIFGDIVLQEIQSALDRSPGRSGFSKFMELNPWVRNLDPVQQNWLSSAFIGGIRHERQRQTEKA